MKLLIERITDEEALELLKKTTDKEDYKVLKLFMEDATEMMKAFDFMNCDREFHVTIEQMLKGMSILMYTILMNILSRYFNDDEDVFKWANSIMTNVHAYVQVKPLELLNHAHCSEHGAH